MFSIKSLVCLFSISQLLMAQPFWETKIVPDDAPYPSFFGQYLSVGNNYLVVGSPLNHSYGEVSGAIYGYNKVNGQWIFDQKIKPTDINTRDHLGPVKLYGDTLFAGAYDKEVYGVARFGAVYHFIKSDSLWNQLQKIIPLDTLPVGSKFGRRLAINDQFLVVSAELDRENGMQSGSVYVFKKENGEWSQHQKLFPKNGIEYQRFGSSIAMIRKLLFIGARDEDNIIGNSAGAVYVYELIDSLWIEREKIINERGSDNEAFGTWVDVSGYTLAIGAPGNIFSDFPGKVSIYDFENGIIELSAELRASDADYLNVFGGRFHLKKDSIIITAIYDNEIAIQAGALYLFKKIMGGWREKIKITASDGKIGDRLGKSVEMINGLFAAGAPEAEDINGDIIGAVYIFQDSPTSIDDDYFSPEKFYLSQNYPNPFNPSTNIQYSISRTQFVMLKVYDVLGNEIATLVNEEKPAGSYEVEFDGSNLASGIYIYRLTSGNFTASKKLILLK